ncbi:hypothetical protein [Niabella aurantiaca]|uniref:hypothetical protein n=1 Tax=Niabella aurantiaca TaxID=379900 RepID=UPI000594C300|nr:hypothetical protein [Niabella aurantiaca]
MILKLAIMLVLAGLPGAGVDPGPLPGELLISGHFEGNEPFWKMEITNNRIVLQCANDTLQDTLLLSRKQQHSETYAFRGRHLFGIVRYPGSGGCMLDITEEEKPSHEIYFSYRGITYMGCGKLKKK